MEDRAPLLSSADVQIGLADVRPDVGEITNRAGLRLATFVYAVSNPKAVVVHVHGVNAHSHWEWMEHPGCVYDGSWAQALNKAGFSVFMLDHQGHGRSESARNTRGYIERFDDLVDDLVPGGHGSGT